MKSQEGIIGIDEVGRGPLAGPLTLCACFIPKEHKKKVHKELLGITDSKKLSPKEREEFFAHIKELSDKGYLSYALAHISPHSIDNKGLSRCLQLGIVRVLKQFPPHKGIRALLDGSLYAPKEYQQETIIKGDESVLEISIASVIAKVVRDKKMTNYSKKYPEYAFDTNKGYGTLKHRQALKKYGTTKIHRQSWIKH
ncbi:MAG: ribonuclease HII [Candidatus Pacebacteria bacterium]|nr:ribonuclease HII [Candidatus Paceibacterota bacterium]